MKKSKVGVLALLLLLGISAAGTLFSFVYVQFKDSARQNRLKIFQDFERQEKEAQVLKKEYRDWKNLPGDLKKFRKDNLLSLDEFAAFRRDLDAHLAANQMHPVSIDFNYSNSQDTIKKVAVRFSLEGSYLDLKKFIFDMEAKSKMYFIERLDLSSGATTVKCAFALEVYLGE